MKRLVFLIPVLIVACSLPPEVPITRAELMRTQVYRNYVIQESPEEVVNALNRHGEVILASKRNLPDKNIPVYIKLLATADGLEVLEYER